jgi:hypothetical protein
MIDMGLTPGMRALGFTATGRRFRMQMDRHWAEVTIVESQSLTSECVRFTLRLRVLYRDEWAEQLRVRPYYPQSPTRDTPQPGWESTIGELVTVGGYPIDDLWWELETGQAFDTLTDEVLTTLRTFGLPAISHRIRAAG